MGRRVACRRSFRSNFLTGTLPTQLGQLTAVDYLYVLLWKTPSCVLT